MPALCASPSWVIPAASRALINSSPNMGDQYQGATIACPSTIVYTPGRLFFRQAFDEIASSRAGVANAGSSDELIESHRSCLLAFSV